MMAPAKAKTNSEDDLAFTDDKQPAALQSEGYALDAMSSIASAPKQRSSLKDLDADFKPADVRELGVDGDPTIDGGSDRGVNDDDAGTVEDGSIVDRAGAEYRVYKKRWFGLVALTLLNIIVSWDVSDTQVSP